MLNDRDGVPFNADRVHERARAERAHARISLRPRDRFTVLLAEDDTAMRQLVAGVLRADGHRVVQAYDGRHLVERLAALREQGPVGLVITDVRMPGRSGLDVLADVRALDRAPPVLVITAFGTAEVRETARMLGALAVLDKPFDLLALRDVVRLASGHGRERDLSRLCLAAAELVDPDAALRRRTPAPRERRAAAPLRDRTERGLC